MKTDLMQRGDTDPLLASIILDVEHHYNIELTETSGYRKGDPGVHGVYPSRGKDASCPDEEFGVVVVKYVNSKYQYDPDRPHLNVCLWHGDPKHLHFQVHPNTIVVNQ